MKEGVGDGDLQYTNPWWWGGVLNGKGKRRSGLQKGYVDEEGGCDLGKP